MNKNPLVDVAAILLCLLAVVALGQYYIAKKQNEVFQVPSKLSGAPAYTPKFESLVKRTD